MRLNTRHAVGCCHDSQGHVKTYFGQALQEHAKEVNRMVLPPGIHDEVFILAVENGKTMRKASMKFHVAKVQRPLASAAKVVEAGNRIVMEKGGSFIENVATGEKMKLSVERGHVRLRCQLQQRRGGHHHLAGVNVRPEGTLKDILLRPPEPGLKMTAANGTEIPNKGCKAVEFVGSEPVFSRRA